MQCYALTSSCPLLPLLGPQVPSQCPWLYSSPQTGLSVCVVLITILLEIGYSDSFNTCFEIVSAILIHLPFSLYFRNNFFIFKKSSRDFDQNYLKSIDLFGEELILLHWVFQSEHGCSSTYSGFWSPLSVFCTDASQFMLALQLISYFGAIVNSSVLKFCVSTLHN